MRAGTLLTAAPMPALQTLKAQQADGRELPSQVEADRVVLSAAPADADGDLRFTAVQPGAQGVVTFHQARFGRAGTKGLNELELVPAQPHGNTYRLMWRGTVVAASHVQVETAEGWRRELAPAPDGTITFEPWIPGLYVLSVTARVNNGSVTIDGTRYQDVRHSATLSFEAKPRP